MRNFTNFEKHLLSQACPSLDLPPLPDNASDVDYAERAAKWQLDATDDILSWAKILGVVPSNYEERLELIHIP